MTTIVYLQHTFGQLKLHLKVAKVAQSDCTQAPPNIYILPNIWLFIFWFLYLTFTHFCQCNETFPDRISLSGSPNLTGI